jgi:hypothetical protein
VNNRQRVFTDFHGALFAVMRDARSYPAERQVAWARWGSGCNSSEYAVSDWDPEKANVLDQIDCSLDLAWLGGLFIARLQRLAQGEGGSYERQRRHKLGKILTDLNEERLKRPSLLVETPLEVLAQELEQLPAGVHLAPGRITVDFEEPKEALEKLMALAMIISNDFSGFDRMVGATVTGKINRQTPKGWRQMTTTVTSMRQGTVRRNFGTTRAGYPAKPARLRLRMRQARNLTPKVTQ